MQEKIDEIVRNYFEDPVYDIGSVPFGLTNLTKILTMNGKKYVIRIYNRHTKNIESIKFEARITSYLSKQNLSFVVPVFLNTYEGEKYVNLSDGTFGAIVSFVEGTVPELTNIQQATEFGRVVGEINLALSQYEAELKYEGSPFSKIYDLHPLADYHAVAAFIEAPPFEIPEKALTFYKEMVFSVEEKKNELLELSKQLVHHDLLIYNLLSKDNRIHGVLDFDFTSLDVSFMEFTISLNHVIQLTNGSWDLTEAFINGYSQIRKSTYREMNQLQLLTQIYHIAVLHIYIGQYYSGRNIEQNFNYILNQFLTRNDWLNKHSSSIKQLFEKYLL
ncbi:phosphotransferase [Paenibacillus harenae]|uniref:Ser/Thr protein kinase RdoA (MazF antagonist) n=1 Tax=Paenibacillus harenae TaxID=306543 RepID=A0ABT9UAS8_PAEHA|nr:phosphotransferase [Paenibacillus harenae]MDQ0116751.1 Ser/Thr protein kinase RdoA (MazF antagonist) [Paenibacillus harenae]